MVGSVLIFRARSSARINWQSSNEVIEVELCADCHQLRICRWPVGVNMIVSSDEELAVILLHIIAIEKDSYAEEIGAHKDLKYKSRYRNLIF